MFITIKNGVILPLYDSQCLAVLLVGNNKCPNKIIYWLTRKDLNFQSSGSEPDGLAVPLRINILFNCSIISLVLKSINLL